MSLLKYYAVHILGYDPDSIIFPVVYGQLIRLYQYTELTQKRI